MSSFSASPFQTNAPLSIPQAARMAGMSDRQIRYMVLTKRLPAHKNDGRWRIAPEDLLKALSPPGQDRQEDQDGCADFLEIDLASLQAPQSPTLRASSQPLDRDDGDVAGPTWRVTVRRPDGAALDLAIHRPNRETAAVLLQAFLQG